jgi:zinc transport system substrate-binding protein
MKNLKGTPCICNKHIKEMLEYLGLKVVATYGRKEELTPIEIKNLIKIGKEEGVLFIIDNLQAGLDTGKIIADELKISHLTISNFPNGFPKTPTLRETLLENVKRIVETYEKDKNKVK